MQNLVALFFHFVTWKVGYFAKAYLGYSIITDSSSRRYACT